MVTEVSVLKFRQNLSQILNAVQDHNDAVLVTMDGKAMAALVNVGLFERMRKMQEQFDELVGKKTQDFRDISGKLEAKELDVTVAREPGQPNLSEDHTPKKKTVVILKSEPAGWSKGSTKAEATLPETSSQVRGRKKLMKIAEGCLSPSARRRGGVNFVQGGHPELGKRR